MYTHAGVVSLPYAFTCSAVSTQTDVVIDGAEYAARLNGDRRRSADRALTAQRLKAENIISCRHARQDRSAPTLM